MRSSRGSLAFENLLCGFLAGADAIWYADAAVAVAGEGQFRQLLAEALDAVEAFEVADAVLGHGGLPFIDTGKERLGAEAEDLPQLVADYGDNGVVGELPDAFGVRSGEKATQQGAVFGSAVGELAVDESCGQEALAFAARDEEPEAGREGFAD